MSNRVKIKKRKRPRCHGPMTQKTHGDGSAFWACEKCGRLKPRREEAPVDA